MYFLIFNTKFITLLQNSSFLIHNLVSDIFLVATGGTLWVPRGNKARRSRSTARYISPNFVNRTSTKCWIYLRFLYWNFDNLGENRSRARCACRMRMALARRISAGKAQSISTTAISCQRVLTGWLFFLAKQTTTVLRWARAAARCAC